MLFNSFEFLIFLPLVFTLYWAVARSLRLQNALLVAASYVFYAWWDARFLLLIVFITLAGYLAGRAMQRVGAGSPASRVVCAVCVAVCLGTLGLFKYYDFFAASTNRLLHFLGITSAALPLWRLLLPMGISFYTFQVLSYAIDVHRRRLSATSDPLAFAAYVSFFPQLVAGPIERAVDLLPQMRTARRFRYDEAVDGLRQMLWGWMKKVLVADNCAAVVNAVYAVPDGGDASAALPGGPALWCATFLFAIQIYGDFSGYSDMAVGMARLFGIRLTVNFRHPYFARSIPEFWKRWHISLTRWFTDYVYIPLGGSRRGTPRTLINTFVVFLVSGLWHGAAFNFIFWGLFHALLFVPHIFSSAARSYRNAPEARPRDLPRMLLTFFLVLIGWVFFRSQSLTQAFAVLCTMFTDFTPALPAGASFVLVLSVAMLLTEWFTRREAHPFRLLPSLPLLRRSLVRRVFYAVLIFITLEWGGSQAAFIYFQF